MKVELEMIAEVLRNRGIEDPTVEQILREILEAKESETGGEPKPPKEKKQFVVLLSDPDGEIPKHKQFVAWVTQIGESENPMTAIDKVRAAAHDFNTSPRGRKLPVMSVGEACEATSARYFKDQGVAVKTKVPVYAIPTDNRLEHEESREVADAG